MYILFTYNLFLLCFFSSILGPPALRQAAEMKDGLTHNARPIYNYSMRGVVTCFTGIRKKDELVSFVNVNFLSVMTTMLILLLLMY